MKKQDSTRIGGTLLVFGAAQFILALVICEALYPGYSTSRNFISDLGVGATAPIFNASVAVLGILTLASAYLFRQAKRLPPYFIALMSVTGIGALGVGLFPENTGAPHLLSALAAFSVGALTAIASSRQLKPPISHLSIALGALSLASLLLGLSSNTLGLGPGGIERLVAYPIFIWAILFGSHMAKEE